jgi:hypothetical protein
MDHLAPESNHARSPAFWSRILMISGAVALIILNNIYTFLFQNRKYIHALLYLLYPIYAAVILLFLIDYSSGLKSQIAASSLALVFYPAISFYGLIKKVALQFYFFATFFITGLTTLTLYVPGLLGFSDVFISLTYIRLINIPAIFTMTLAIVSYVIKQRDRIEFDMEKRINRQIKLIHDQQTIAVQSNHEKQELLKLVGSEMRDPLLKSKMLINTESDYKMLGIQLKSIMQGLLWLSEKILLTGSRKPESNED